MVSGQKGGSHCRSTLRRKCPKVADCLKDSLDNSEMLIEESQITEGERSPTRMETAAVVADERVEIQFNDDGLPIGEASVGLSSLMGEIVREVVPYTISDWRKVPSEMTEDLWKRIQVIYKVDKEWQKRYIIKQMSACWRSSKSRLVSQIRNASNEEEILELRPDNIKSIQDWNDFVKEKTSETFKAKSEKFRELKRRQTPHTCSRRGYARVTDDMRRSSGDPSSVSKGSVWAQAHIRKNGEPVNVVVAETIAKIRQAENGTSSSATKHKEDALLKVLDPQNRGQVRLLRKLQSKEYRKKLRISYRPETNLTEANCEEESEKDGNDESDCLAHGSPRSLIPMRDLEEFEDGDEETDEEECYVEADNGWNRQGSTAVRPSSEHAVFCTLANSDVFSCCICSQPLTLPVFQCENAHLACSPCSTKVRSKCPSCHSNLNTRCIAVEKILESVIVRCQNANYGCTEIMSYSKKYNHEKTCPRAPCSCPLSDCDYCGSFSLLYQHFKSEHNNSAFPFLYDSLLNITLNVNEKFLVLQEERDGVLFILRNRFTEHVGNAITVNCMADPGKGIFGYNVIARFSGGDLRFQSFTKSIRNLDEVPLFAGSLLVPSECFDSSGMIQLDLCIWRSGTLSACS